MTTRIITRLYPVYDSRSHYGSCHPQTKEQKAEQETKAEANALVDQEEKEW